MSINAKYEIHTAESLFYDPLVCITFSKVTIRKDTNGHCHYGDITNLGDLDLKVIAHWSGGGEVLLYLCVLKKVNAKS